MQSTSAKVPPPSPSCLTFRNLAASPHQRHSRRNWIDLAPCFPVDMECLAAFLALETAEVLAGEKPANLIRINNRRKSCGRNLYQLWQNFGSTLLGGTNLKVMCLRSSKDGKLLLFYVPSLLKRSLQPPSTTSFLQRLGYPDVSNLQDTLHELHLRFQNDTSSMPHEIGLFLGYPLKDVAGFMHRDKQTCTGRRLWCFYGDPIPSLELWERFTACRNRMAERLRSSCNPLTLLSVPRAAQFKSSTI